MSSELVWLSQASQPLQKVATVGEMKAIVDRVSANKVFAKQRWTEEQQCRLAEMDVRVAMPKAKGARGNGRPKLGGTKGAPPKSGEPTLEERDR
jgi:hypothetical protein